MPRTAQEVPPKRIAVCKADPTTGNDVVRGAVLEIDGDIHSVTEGKLDSADWRHACIVLYQSDAALVVEALAALPQGTLDQVLLLLLTRRASLLRVQVETREIQ